MRIYLRERPEVFPGMETIYAREIETVVYPMMATVEFGMQPVGLFSCDVTYGKWPRFGILWGFEGGWKTIIEERRGGLAEYIDPKMIEWLAKANQWRERSTEWMLVPTPFSPQPEPLPARTSPGGIFLDQRFVVARGRSKAFLESFEKDVLPAAQANGLKLELCARALGRLNEVFALWSVPSWDDKARIQEERQSEGDYLPGIAQLWPDIEDFEEETLRPWPFSPLGGTREANATS